MTDIVDAFVVSLGIDASEYEQEIKKFREDRKRLSTEDESFNRRQQDGQRKTIDGFRKIRNEVGGFLLLLAGANSLKNFVGDMLTGDAATGRFAANIGMATERVSVWENAIKQVGGSAQDAQGAIRALSNIFQEYQLLGDNSKSGDLAFFGLREQDLKNPDEALMKLAERGEGLKGERRAEFTMRLNRLGLNDSMVTLLAKGRQPLEQMLDGIEKAGVATDESAKAAQDLEAEMAKLAQSIQGAVRPAISDIAEWFTKLTAIIRDDVVPILSKMVRILRPIFGGGESTRDENNNLRPGYRKVPVGPAWLHMYRDEKIPAGAGGGGALGAADNLLRGMGFRVPSLAASRGAAPSVAGGGAVATGSGSRNAVAVERYFRGKGFSPAQAKGIAAAVVAEGGLNTRTGGGYKGRALGIGQWLGSRRKEFLRRYGQNFTLQNELDFFYEEMHRGDGKFVGNKIKQTENSGAIAKMMVDEFYRPAKGAETTGDYNRAARYLRTPASAVGNGRPVASNTSNSTTTIGQVNVYSSASNAEGIARDIRGELAKRDMVVQATSGLKA